MTQGRLTRRRILQASGVAIASGLAGCGGGGGDSDSEGGDSTPTGELTISIGESPHFDPESATVGVGERVVWESGDGSQHTLVGQSAPEGSTWNGAPASPIRPSTPYSNVFDVPGEYTFSCNIHPARESGTLTVRE